MTTDTTPPFVPPRAATLHLGGTAYAHPDLAPLVRSLTEHPIQRSPSNPRKGDHEAIVASIRTNGVYSPVKVQRSTGYVLAGNHTYDAVTDQGGTSLPWVWLDVDDDEARRIMLADNRTAELGGYDEVLLLDSIRAAVVAEAGLVGTGYSDDDLADLERAVAAAQIVETRNDPDATPAIPDDAYVPFTRLGDIWTLGPHRIMCGDSRDAAHVAALMDGAKAQMAFTSPPYASQREYDTKSGFTKVTPSEYVDWFRDIASNARAHLTDDGSWFLNIAPHAESGQRDLYVNDLVAAHVRDWGWMFVDEFCWVDTKNGVPGGWPNRFKAAWEPVYHFATQSSIVFHPLANGTDSNDVFDYSPETAKSGTGSGLLGEKATGTKSGIARPSNVVQIAASSSSVEHSAQFPVALPAWFIRAFSDPRSIVYDPFMGSGTTLIAAHDENRVAYGMEISPTYCDVICRRFQEHTGITPIRDGEEVTFA